MSATIIAFPVRNVAAATADGQVALAGDIKAELNRLSDLAPSAPLSCLFVQLYGPVTQAERIHAETIMRETLRPLDRLGPVDRYAWAALLQGGSAGIASVMAARLSFALNRYLRSRGAKSAEVGVATGMGSHGALLLDVARASFPEVS